MFKSFYYKKLIMSKKYYNPIDAIIILDIIPSNLFQGIPGLDLSLRKEIYEQKNLITHLFLKEHLVKIVKIYGIY